MPFRQPAAFSALRAFSTALFGLMAISGATNAAAGAFGDCQHYFHSSRAPMIAAETVPGARRALCFSEFAVLHSGQTRTPLFVAQRLDPMHLNGAEPPSRTERFYEEARLPARERASLASYRHSGFDRGHLAPAADMRTEEGMAQSFSLANIVPQAPVHNRKSWKKIEQDTRKYVKRSRHPVYVITGAHFDNPERSTVGGFSNKQVSVPDALYKLVIDPSRGKAWAHWLENNDAARVGAPISVGELSRRTGIQFSIGNYHEK